MRRAQGTDSGVLLGGVILQSPEAAAPTREQLHRESKSRMAHEEGSNCIYTSDDDVDLSTLSDAEEESRRPINAGLAFSGTLAASSSTAPRMAEPATPHVINLKPDNMQAPPLNEVVAPMERADTQGTAFAPPAADVAAVASTTDTPGSEPSLGGRVPHEEATSDLAHAARRLRVAAGTYGEYRNEGNRQESGSGSTSGGGSSGNNGGQGGQQRGGIEDQVDMLRRQLASLREQLATDQQAHGGRRVHEQGSRQVAPSAHIEQFQGAAFVAPYSERPRGGNRKNHNYHHEAEDYRALSAEQLEAMEVAAGPFADFGDDDEEDDDVTDERGNAVGEGVVGEQGRSGISKKGSSSSSSNGGWWSYDPAGNGGGCAVSTMVELDLLGNNTRSGWLAPPAPVRGPFHPENTAPLPPRFQPLPSLLKPMPPQPPPSSSQRATGVEAWASKNREFDLDLQEYAVGLEPFQGSLLEQQSEDGDDDSDGHHNSENRPSERSHNKTNLRAGLAALEKYGQGLAQELEEARSQLESCHAHHAAELREFDHQLHGLGATRARHDSEDETNESNDGGLFGTQNGVQQMNDEDGTEEQQPEESVNQGDRAGNSNEATDTATAALGEARSLFAELQAAFSSGGYDESLYTGTPSQHTAGPPRTPQRLAPASYMSPARGSTRSGLRGSYNSSAGGGGSSGGGYGNGDFGHSKGALPWARSSPREKSAPKSQTRKQPLHEPSTLAHAAQPLPPRPAFAPYVHGLGNSVHVSVEKQGITLVAGISNDGGGASAGTNRRKANQTGVTRAGSIQAAQTRPFGMATSSKRQPNDSLSVKGPSQQRIARAPVLR